MDKEDLEYALNEYFKEHEIVISSNNKIYVSGNKTRLSYHEVTEKSLTNEAYLGQTIDLIKYFYFRKEPSDLDFLRRYDGKV